MSSGGNKMNATTQKLERYEKNEYHEDVTQKPKKEGDEKRRKKKRGVRGIRRTPKQMTFNIFLNDPKGCSKNTSIGLSPVLDDVPNKNLRTCRVFELNPEDVFFENFTAMLKFFDCDVEFSKQILRCNRHFSKNLKKSIRIFFQANTVVK